jgi:hypothetical protein
MQSAGIVFLDLGGFRFMNKSMIILLLIFYFFACPTFAQNVTSDLRHDGLLGKVKSVRYETAKLVYKSRQWIEQKRELNRTISYDESGHITREDVFTDIKDEPDLDKRAKTQVTYRYDAKGNRIETVIVKTMMENDSRLLRRVFKHDKSGNRIEESIFGKKVEWTEHLLPTGPTNALGGEGLMDLFVHTYDTRGNRATTERKEKGIVQDKWIYTTDESGRVVEMTHYRRNRIRVKETYEYDIDEVGNWVKRVKSKVTDKEGGTELIRQEVSYRTIVYY